MAFEEQLPQWENEGTQPPQSKRVEGWLPNEKPPASWFNWLFHRAYKALQELQEKAGERVDVEQAQQTADDATTAAANAQSDIDAHLADSTNPHNVTKAQVGLGNVDNMSATSIRTDSGRALRVEVVSSSGSESPEQGRIIFDTSQGKFFGGNGSEWV